MTSATDEIEEEVEVVYEEVPQPHVIETGDSLKVKQVLDDAVMSTVADAGYEMNFKIENLKLLLMLLACLSALCAQFYPMPFPSSIPLLMVCCAIYFVISMVLTAIVTFIDKDTIILTKANKVFEHEMRIRAKFERFQEYYDLVIQFKDQKSPCTTGKMYVGKYFTLKGEFDEEAFKSDVKTHIDRFVNEKYTEFVYNHKMD
mmetsp:Transcript_14419/g.19753  ORF Transcript_14419/g.19753 Transcript_14419/m.19753 type:complete len:202 (-) Transcript_14419:77-682(-)